MARTPSDQDIILVKPSRGKVPTTLFSNQELQNKGLDSILLLHAFTGCDTTSPAFCKSKIGFWKLYLKSHELREAAEIFSHPSSSPEQIQEQGFLRWCGAKPKETSLNKFATKAFWNLFSMSNLTFPLCYQLSVQLPNTFTAATNRFRFGCDMSLIQSWRGTSNPHNLMWSSTIKSNKAFQIDDLTFYIRENNRMCNVQLKVEILILI